MTDIKQICLHHLNGNCKYGDKCTKIHTESNPDLLDEINKKGTAVCNYFPNCKFISEDCKRLHIITKKHQSDEIDKLREYYYKIVELSTTDQEKTYQIERIKKLIKLDLEFVKSTYECLTSQFK